MTANYAPEQRAEALLVYAAAGPSEAARRTGIPKGTISAWAARQGVQTSAHKESTRAATEAAVTRSGERRQVIRDRLLDVSERILDRMMDAGSSAGDLRQLAIALGVVIDKYRLEVGEATGRSEVDVRSRLARAAAEMGLDLAEVEAEAERLMGPSTG